MATNEIGGSVQSQRTVAPITVGMAPVMIGLQRSTELDNILSDLMRETPVEASVRERTLTKSWGAKEREFSAPQGCVSTQSGDSQTVLTWQTSNEGPRKCVTVSKETTKRPSSGAFPPQTGSGHHQEDAFPVRFTDDRNLLDTVAARRFQGPPSYQESRTLQTHSETRTRERVLSPVFRRPVQTDRSRVTPTDPSRRRVFSPEIMSDGTVPSRNDYSLPLQSYSLPHKRSVPSYRNYASDSEEALTWLEEQRRKLEQKRAERTMNYRQQHFVGDRSKSSTDFTRSGGGSSYSRRPVYPQSDTDDLSSPKSRVPPLKNSLSVDGLNRTTGKTSGYSRNLEPPRFTKDYGDFTRFKLAENRADKLVENRIRSDVADNRSRDERFSYVSSIQRPSSATPHTKYSFTMPGLASDDYPGRRAQLGLSAPTSPVIPVRGGSSREAVVRSRGKAREWLGVTDNATYERLDEAQQQLGTTSGVRLSSPLKPTPTETELISLQPIGPGVQDLEPGGTIDGTLNFTRSTPTLHPTVQQDYTDKSHEKLRSHSSLGRVTQFISPAAQRRDLSYATMPISTGDSVGFAPLRPGQPAPRPFTSLGPAPLSDDLGNYQAERRIYSPEAVHASLAGSGQTGYDVQRYGQVWSRAGQQALNQRQTNQQMVNQQWIQQQPLSQQQQVQQQELQYRQQVQQQTQVQRQQEQQRQWQLQQEQQRQLQLQQEQQQHQQEQQRQLQLQQEQQRQLQLQQEQQKQLQQEQQRQWELQQEQQRQLQLQQEQQRQLQLQLEQQRQLQLQQEQQRQLQLQQEQQQHQEQQRQLQLQQEQQRQLQLQQEQQRQLQQQEEQQRQLQLQQQQRHLQQQQQYRTQTQAIQRTYIVEQKTEPHQRPLATQTLDSRVREISFASAQPVSQFTSQETFRESSFAEPHRSTRSDAAVQVDNVRWNDQGRVAASDQFGAQMTEGRGVGASQMTQQAGQSQTGEQVVEQRYVVERQTIGTSQGGDRVGTNQMGRQIGISQFGGQVGIEPAGGHVGQSQEGRQVIEQRCVAERQVVGASQAGQQIGTCQVGGGQMTEAQAVRTGQTAYHAADQGGTHSGTQQASHQQVYTYQSGTADKQNSWLQSTGTRYGTEEGRYGQQSGTAYRQQQQEVRFGGDEMDTGGEKRILSSPGASQRVEVMSTERGDQHHQQLQQQQQSYAHGFQQVGERSDAAQWMQRGGMKDQAIGSINAGGSWTLRPEVTSRSGGHQRNSSTSFVERYTSPRFGLGHARTASATCLADGAEWSHQPPRFVRDTSKFWHKPNISRDDAINLLLDKQPGSFVVRDSATFPGSFGLALKVSQVPPNMQTKGGDPQVDLIRHFLIEPTPKGVRLKGCSSEPVFGSLAALIYQHSITPLSLPCKLKLPDEDIGGSDAVDGSATLGGSDSIAHGAACTVLYVSSVGTENLTGPEALSRSLKDLFESGRPLPRSTIVQFKVTRDGITLTDNRRRIFFRRFYPIQTVTFCGTDPRDRRWTVKSEDLTISGKAFGFVARKPGVARENACHIFLELDPTQPASVIVNFVTKILIGQGQRLLQR